LAPFADAIYSEILGPDAPTPPLPPDIYGGVIDAEAGRAFWEALPRVRVLMENGAGSATPGLPAPRFELGFKKWPIPGTRATALYFGVNGTLARSRSHDETFDTYNPDPEARPMQTLPG